MISFIAVLFFALVFFTTGNQKAIVEIKPTMNNSNVNSSTSTTKPDIWNPIKDESSISSIKLEIRKPVKNETSSTKTDICNSIDDKATTKASDTNFSAVSN